MSLFGSTSTPASSTPLFGAAPTTAGAAKPLFGTPSTAAPSTGGLFGSTSTTAATSTPLFGATSAPAATSTPLFGAAPAATAAATPASGGLFGSKPTTTAPATTSLFGASTGTTPSLTLGTTTAATGGLFGAKPTTTTAPTLGGGLFGASTTANTASPFAASAPATTAPSLGLGGVQQSAATTNASGSAVNSLSGTDKDTTKDAENQAINFIREMLPLIEDRLKKNRDIMEETENMSNMDSGSIDDMIDKTRGWIGEVRQNVRSAMESAENVAQLAANDKMLLDTAKRVQEQASTANQTAHSQFIKKHLAERTMIYDMEMQALQNRVTDLRTKFEKLLKGETSISMMELEQYFRRSDSNAANAQDEIIRLGKEIEQVKNQLIEQGYTHLRRSAYPSVVSTTTEHEGEGADFFPSRSSLAVIGSALKAPAPAGPAVGGLGLSSGTGLFGSSTGGSTLFGSSTAAKPAFSGSLFGSLNTTPATTTAAATTTPSLFGSKPATTTFASTVSNNSSGLLFSSKK